MNPVPVTSSRRTARARGRVAAALACALLLSGCGLRFDSAPPTEPVPDPIEIVRRTAVDDALHVAEQADAVAGLDATKPEVAEALSDIAEISRQHADQLGGVYESGLELELPSPTPSDVAETTPEVAEVLITLTDAAARSATAADVCEDGPLARLLASISAAQTLSVRKLADVTGEQGPEFTEPLVPGAAELPATPSATAEGTGPSDGTASLTPSTRPTAPPGGLSDDDLVAVVLAEDSSAYALEVGAARTDQEKARDRLADRALTHRRRAEDWARFAGIDGTEKDPRRAAYELPSPDATGKELLLEAENGLAADYANLVGLAEEDTRSSAVALLTDSAITRNSWGAPITPFPGLPEQASS
ncbi:DUF4439 domain-containing protein [Myceligenerans indicum]|uniref:DUF4439 domain-containing protein n=1 Tax=Myceligenerans indicum TaxID=2593663 RepID=A0ABS1LJS4_9MICO|nr:DUF4439 domain-containing protein [Myceligenerans indicum]MBL0886490.1 DUF4439 domain-containing protein [Myceligenerans indicum]